MTKSVGLLVEKENPTALAEALISVLGNLGRYQPAELRKHAVERYEWGRRVAKQIHGIYLETVPR